MLSFDKIMLFDVVSYGVFRSILIVIAMIMFFLCQNYIKHNGKL